MTNWTSALSPFSRKGLPTLPLLLLLVYAVVSSLLGASIRHLESQSRQSIEMSYAASTLEKDLVSLMRDAQAMVGAPSQLRMQALLINLAEYETALDEMSAHTPANSALHQPLGELEAALPSIRNVIHLAARLDAARDEAAIEQQALSLTRLESQMQAQVSEIESFISSAPSLSEQLADTLRLFAWIVHLLAVGIVMAMAYSALKSRPSELSEQTA